MDILFLIFALFLGIIGVWLARGLVRNRRLYARSKKSADKIAAFEAKRRLRRSLIEVLLSLVIAVVLIGLFLQRFLTSRPFWFGLYWLVVLILTLYVFLLGLLDARDVLISFRNRRPRL